jgi:hypothetical protein
MIVKVANDFSVAFEDRANFRAFKVTVDGDRADIDAVRDALSEIAELPDSETAWVFEAALRNWDGVAGDAQWQDGFSTMVEKARPHGWIDDARKAIKAHVEWQS